MLWLRFLTSYPVLSSFFPWWSSAITQLFSWSTICTDKSPWIENNFIKGHKSHRMWEQEGNLDPSSSFERGGLWELVCVVGWMGYSSESCQTEQSWLWSETGWGQIFVCLFLLHTSSIYLKIWGFFSER